MMCVSVITLIPSNIWIYKFPDLQIIFRFGFVPQKRFAHLLPKLAWSWWHSDRLTQWQCWHDEGCFADCWLYGISSNSIEDRQCMRWSAEDSQGTQCLVTPAGPHISSVSAVVKMWRGPVSEHDCAEKPPYRRTTTARPRTRHCGDLTNNNTTAATPQQTRRFLPLFRNLETSNSGDFIIKMITLRNMR